MMKSLLLCVVSLITALCSPLMAQQTNDGTVGWCGTAGKSEWLTEFQANGSVYDYTKSNGIQYIPLNVVFVGDNSGSGYVDPLRFLNSLSLLNRDYKNMDIQFYIADNFRYVNNSAWYSYTDISVGNQMMRANNIRNRMNTYIVENPRDNVCGYYTRTEDAVALKGDCLTTGDRTWAHEVGHFLSLPHTFYGWESVEEIDNIDFNSPAPATVRYRGENIPVELVDGSNCNEAADGFCDTPSDFLMQRWPCTGNGFYRDSLTDPAGVRFAVPANNIMSYAQDVCVSEFSEEQQIAMLANLSSRVTLADDSGIGEVASEVDSMENLLPIDNDRLTYYDSVRLVWSSEENADFYLVQVHSSTNFVGAVLSSFITQDTFAVMRNLEERSRYYWRVRPINRYVVESEFGDVWRFRTGDRLTNTIDESFDAALTIAPNPIGTGRELRVEGRDLETGGNLNLDLIDAAGRVLEQRRNIVVNAGGFTERLRTDNLTPGVYFLRLRLDDRLVTRRVVITP